MSVVPTGSSAADMARLYLALLCIAGILAACTASRRRLHAAHRAELGVEEANSSEGEVIVGRISDHDGSEGDEPALPAETPEEEAPENDPDATMALAVETALLIRNALMDQGVPDSEIQARAAALHSCVHIAFHSFTPYSEPAS